MIKKVCVCSPCQHVRRGVLRVCVSQNFLLFSVFEGLNGVCVRDCLSRCCVRQARDVRNNEVVAIKKMSYNGKQTTEVRGQLQHTLKSLTDCYTGQTKSLSVSTITVTPKVKHSLASSHLLRSHSDHRWSHLTLDSN